jgi:hypothetical protein
MPGTDEPIITYSPAEVARRVRWSEDCQRAVQRAIDELNDLNAATHADPGGGCPETTIQLLCALLDRLGNVAPGPDDPSRAEGGRCG